MRQPRPCQTSVAIIGAGIGGLATAVSLLRAGFDVQSFSQSPSDDRQGVHARVLAPPRAALLNSPLVEDLIDWMLADLGWDRLRLHG